MVDPLIDCDFPGGNIIVEGIDGDDVRLRQDLRDTDGFWFWWSMRVRGAAGRTLRFNFTDGKVVGVRGPAASPDGGRTWRWLTELADDPLGGAAIDGQIGMGVEELGNMLEMFGIASQMSADEPDISMRVEPVFELDEGFLLGAEFCRIAIALDEPYIRVGYMGESRETELAHFVEQWVHPGVVKREPSRFVELGLEPELDD